MLFMYMSMYKSLKFVYLKDIQVHISSIITRVLKVIFNWVVGASTCLQVLQWRLEKVLY